MIHEEWRCDRCGQTLAPELIAWQKGATTLCKTCVMPATEKRDLQKAAGTLALVGFFFGLLLGPGCPATKKPEPGPVGPGEGVVGPRPTPQEAR